MHTGRNDPCPCGSGRKYKKCCLARETAAPAAASQVAPRREDPVAAAKQALARGQLDRARELLAKELTRRRVPAATWSLAGGIELQAKAFARARDYFGRALALAPDNASYRYNHATALALAGEREAAAKALKQVVRARPDLYQAYNNLANVLRDLGRPDEALGYYLEALDFNLRQPTGLSHLLFSLHQFAFEDDDRLFELHCRVGERLTALAPGGAAQWRPTAPRADGRIRIGYLSPRFSRTIVGYFFKPLLDAQDRDRFDVYLYSATREEDDLTAWFRERADGWRDVSRLSDRELCRRVADDEIDILIDLAGHAPENRLVALAAKPAPVQVSMLDYFDTTGVPAIDYLVTDRVSTPPESPQRFTESCLVLDQPRLVYEAPAYAPPVTVRPATAGELVFGSFNRHEKTSTAVVEAWSALLRAVPSARLLLKNRAYAEAELRDSFLSRFTERGIAPERIEFRPASPHAGMLAEYADMDIALDTFPYNGGLTTCEALWMGTPVLTLEGSRIISRQSSAMLQSVGLDDFVARTQEEFVSKGAWWAAHRDGLVTLRAGLRERMAASPLTDGAAYTRALEQKLCEALARYYDAAAEG
ncbi:MAG: O-linked N-acetylglucosamine transferase family protein [Pseudohaliea sp.]